MTTVRELVFAALSLATCGAMAAEKPKVQPDDPVKQEIAALEKKRGDIRYGALWGSYYLRRFGIEGQPRATDEELAQMRDESAAAFKRLIELRPDDAGYRLGYGEQCVYLGRPAEALPHFRHAIGCAPNDEQWARAMFWTAEAQFATGDRAGTEATLRALVGRNVRTGGRYKTDWTGYGRWVLRWFAGNEPDALGLPHGTLAKPFPQPQEATYTEKFTKLNAVALKLEGVKPDDARVRLLKTKFRRIGILFLDEAPFTVTLACDPAASVAEREGYTLDVTPTNAVVRARDAQGILWGVVSLVQSVNPEKRCVRQLSVRDWPVGEGRGFLGCFTPDALEYTLFLKMNSVDFQRACPISNDCMTPLRMYMCEQMAREYNELGLTMYVDGHWLGEAPDLPACEPRAFEYRVDVCRRFAKIGAGVYWAQDDGRFPLNERDKKAYGTAANCDAKHITAVYRAVKKDYPDFKMIYCPPFYWGPDARASYPEDRETYLKSIGEFMDPEIDVYWTGPQVKGLDKKPYQVKWFADLTKRKPSIFQNAICPHFFVDFLVDPIPWDKLHYDGFLKDIRHFHLNCNGYHEIGPLSLQGAWCWNPKGYDAKAASRAAITQVIGDGVYDALAPGIDDLAYFDKYPWGQVNANILHEDPADLEKKYQNAKQCWEKACKINPKTSGYSWYGGVLGNIPRVLAAAKNPPDLISRYKKESAATREQAIRETKCEPDKGDLVITPIDLNGLQPGTIKIAEDGATRFVKWLRGAQSHENTVSFRFECDPFPPTGDFKLVICGCEDELPAKTQLRIAVNGKPVYEGDTQLPATKGDLRLKGGGNFGRHEFTIPFASMVRKNLVEISCTSPGYNKNGTPYVGVNYIVLRKSR